MVRKVFLVLVLAGLHFWITLVSISKTLNTGSDLINEFWSLVLDIVAFPLLYLQRLEQHWGSFWMFGVDILQILVVLNSIFWGIALVAIIDFFVKKIKSNS